MGIKGLSSAFDTTVDVNNGQSTQTFEQIGDSEFDVDVDGTSSVGNSFTVAYTSRTDNADASDGSDYRLYVYDGNLPGVDSVDWYLKLRNGGQADVSVNGNEKVNYDDGAEATFTGTASGGDYLEMSIAGSEGINLVADVELTFHFSLGTQVNSISQG